MVKGLSAGWGTCSHTVSLDSYILALSSWNKTIAVGLGNGNIILLDAITGSQAAVLSAHRSDVKSLAFSLDGQSLVSGSEDMTIKLWDVQTGGVIKTFHDHTCWIKSVSISADSTRIASAGQDWTIFLWDIQTGKCIHTMKQEHMIYHVSFSPIDPRHIVFVSGGKVWQWDINSHQILPMYNGTHIAFSPDHTQFALCNGNIVTVQNSDSRIIVAEFHVANGKTQYCCFPPNSGLVAAAAGRIAYVWDIKSPDPHLIGTFAGHTKDITSLIFASPFSLISVSHDRSVKFWQIGALSTDPVPADQQFTPSTSPPILSVSLQARAGITISSDINGGVKTWDISTGLCKAAFQIPDAKAGYLGKRDAKLIDGRLIFVWYNNDKVHIWDIGKGELLQTLDTSWVRGLRISGDGSKILCLYNDNIQAWSM